MLALTVLEPCPGVFTVLSLHLLGVLQMFVTICGDEAWCSVGRVFVSFLRRREIQEEPV